MIQKIFGSPVILLTTSNIDKIFSIKTYDKVIECLMHPDNKFIDHPFVRGGKICTTDLNSNMKLDKIEGLNVLFEFLKKTALPYVPLFLDKPVQDLKFFNSWVNLSFQGCEIKNHTDSNEEADQTKKSLIISFYPKAPLGGANLVFIHGSKGDEWASDCSEKDMVEITVEEGNIIIFDNQTLHAVNAHKVNVNRMCIIVEFTME